MKYWSGSVWRVVLICYIHVVSIILHAGPAYVHTTIYDQNNECVYRSHEEYSAKKLPVVAGLEGMYQGAMDNLLYDGSRSILDNQFTLLTKYNLTIFDGSTSGSAVHMLPPRMMGDDIIYEGHVVGEKRCVGDNQYRYDALHCCDQAGVGSLITMQPHEFTHVKEVSIHTQLVSAVTYNAGHAIPQREHLNPQDLFGGPAKISSWSGPETIDSQRYQDHVKKYQPRSWRSCEEYKTTPDYQQYSYRSSSDDGYRCGSRVRQYATTWHEPIAEEDDPTFMHAQPMDYYRIKYEMYDPKDVLQTYKLYQYKGFRQYISCLPGYREHIRYCYEQINSRKWLMYGWRCCVGPLYMLNYGVSLFHVGEHIREMHAEMLACEAQEVRIAQQEAVKESWKKEEAAFVAQPPAHIEPTAAVSDDTNYTFMDDVSEKINNVIVFMDQARINFDVFYDFHGTDVQNELHDEMRDYIFDNAQDAIMPNDTDLVADPVGYCAIRMFQYGFAAAFNFNRAHVTDDAKMIFDVVHRVYDMQSHRVLMRTGEKIGDRVCEIYNDPKQYAADMLQGACVLVVFATKLVTTPLFGASDLLLGDSYMSSDEREAYWESWRNLGRSIHDSLDALKSVDVTACITAPTIKNVHSATKLVHVHYDTIETFAANACVDYAAGTCVCKACAAVTPMLMHIDEVREGIVFLDGLGLGVAQAVECSTTSITEKTNKLLAWWKNNTPPTHGASPQVVGGFSVEGLGVIAQEGAAVSESIGTVSKGAGQFFNEIDKEVAKVVVMGASGQLGQPEESPPSRGSGVLHPWEVPEYIDPASPFPRESTACAENANGVCENPQTIVRGCHRMETQHYNEEFLCNFIKNFEDIVYRYDDIVLTKEQLKHFLERHCVPTWNGSAETIQGFFPRNMGPDEVLEFLKEVINTDTNIKTIKTAKDAGKKGFDLLHTKNGHEYVIHVRGNKIKTFYPKYSYTRVG